MRHGCEPWYTESFNRSMSTILDFGGDRGGLFAGLIPGSSTCVYEISGIDPVPGVTAIRTLEECLQYRFDLIACSNVLEHVASPKGLLDDIKRVASGDTLVFIEVPIEVPFGLLTLTKRIAQQMILLGARPALAASTLPFDFARQVQEHVNFFSLHSLVKLMWLAGSEVLSSGMHPSEGFSFGRTSSPPDNWHGH